VAAYVLCVCVSMRVCEWNVFLLCTLAVRMSLQILLFILGVICVSQTIVKCFIAHCEAAR